MTPTQIGILVLAVIGLALVLAVVINHIGRWWKFRKIIQRMYESARRDGFSLNSRDILPPHKSAARPSNVMALARKPVHPKKENAA